MALSVAFIFIMQHQTQQGARSTRVKKSQPDEDEPSTYHEPLKEGHSKAAGSTVERQARWSTYPKSGAGCNAAYKTFQRGFGEAKLAPPLLAAVTNAGLTNFHFKPSTNSGLFGQKPVYGLVEGDGKNGKHGAVTEHYNGSALSYILYPTSTSRSSSLRMRVPFALSLNFEATSLFHTYQFGHAYRKFFGD
ncbi:hypothetical protein B0H13DRAFT_1870449 [Mycena leptocephala]|nr:hypothetical protein B0H13DRAFT_1870449 [Mycena leptocephala]